MNFCDAIRELIGKQVILDTAGPIFYLGTLRDCNEAGLWLTDADVHDQREGHATKELYVLESCQHGIRVNRQRVFVLRSAILSLSALQDAMVD